MLTVRIKSFLAAARPQLALIDVKNLEQLDEGKGLAMRKEVDHFNAKRVMQNKKLARDVAAWVDTAMKISEQNKFKGNIAKNIELDDYNDFADESVDDLYGM